MIIENLDYTKIATGIITKHTGDIIKSIGSATKSKLADISIETQTAFIAYIQQCFERFSTVKTLINRAIPTPIYDIYIHNYLSLINGQDIQQINSNNINNLLELSSKIMILGSGGTGKSTLFKHLFLNTIKNTDKIPIFVTLREINNTDYNLIDFIYKSMSTMNFTLKKEYLVKSFNTGIYVFFLDGLDEVEEGKRNILIKEINDFSMQYNKNHFLISSRISDAFSGGWEEYTDLKVCQFNSGQAYDLINKLNFDKKVKEEFMKNLQNLYNKHTSFCSNPLLLTLMLMTFDEYAEIPTKIHSFYSYAYDILYSKHDASKLAFKRKMKTDKNHLTYSSFKKILEAFSAIGYFNNEISFNKDNLIENINKAKKVETINLDEVQTKFAEEDFKDDLIESVCIMYIEGLEYSYVHRSFQEFFTANYINRQSNETQTRLLRRIIEKKRASIFSDQLLPMLLDMNKIMVERQLILPFLKSLRKQIGSLSSSEYFDLMKNDMNSEYNLSVQITSENEISITTDDHPQRRYALTSSYNQILLSFIRLVYSGTDTTRVLNYSWNEPKILFTSKDLTEFSSELQGIGLPKHEFDRGNSFIQKAFNLHLTDYEPRYIKKAMPLLIDENFSNKNYLEAAINSYKELFIQDFDYGMNILEKMELEHGKHQLLEEDLF